MRLSLISLAWGDYWERYGAIWKRSVRALSPQPDEVLIGSDRPLDLPDGWRQMRISEPYFWDGYNALVDEAKGEWLVPLMLDDTMPSDALDGLILDCDVECSVAIDSNNQLMIPSLERYMNILDEDWFPLTGFPIMTKQVAQKYPYRPVYWADWVATIEWFAAGVTVRISDKVRYNYTLSKNQRSRPRNPQEAFEQIELMKQMVRGGGVKPGSCWPPEPA